MASQCVVPDHALQQDLSVQVNSPGGLNLYDYDITEAKKPLLSPCSSGFGESLNSPSAETGNCMSFDLNPQFEHSSDLWTILADVDGAGIKDEVDDLKPSITDCADDWLSTINMEDVLMDKKDMHKGPTLAQLNSNMDHGLFDDVAPLATMPSNQMVAPSNGSISAGVSSFVTPRPALGSQHVKQPAPASLGGLNVVTSDFGFTSHSNLTTCTITSPAPVTMDTQAKLCPPVTTTTTVQYLAYPGGAPDKCIVAEPFRTAAALPPLVPPASQVISANPCLNQLLLPIKTEATPTGTPQPITGLRAFSIAPATTTLATAGHVTPSGRGIKRPLKAEGDTTEASLAKDIKYLLEDPPESSSTTSTQAQSTVGGKKIKTEPVDVAYTPPEDPCTAGIAGEDEGFDSGGEGDGDDGGSDSDNDDMSDAESVSSHSSFIEEFIGSSRKDKRFFWQYNTQSKGPKGKRLAKALEPIDPHILDDFEDPVFDPEQQQMKYKHNGKARRGDGNDITPNPYRLFQIGNELSKLNKQINAIVPMVELPQVTRNKKRKEKNKYASRACRLKKKAQHEANKLKLYGLDQEHSQLMRVLELIKREVALRVSTGAQPQGEPLCGRLDATIRKHLTVGMVAGHSADFVNSVLEKVVNGDKTGGISFQD